MASHRTMRLLMECGFAQERHSADGQARFENVTEAGHHDHLICERCGRIVEFVQPQIEQLPEPLTNETDNDFQFHLNEVIDSVLQRPAVQTQRPFGDSLLSAGGMWEWYESW